MKQTAEEKLIRRREYKKRHHQIPEVKEKRRSKIRQRRRALRAEGQDQYQRLRAELLELMGGRCCRCGFSDYRALQIDHVNGGGVKHRRIHGIPGYWKERSLLRDALRRGEKVTEYQLLCANCNWIKRFENNENGGYSKYDNGG